MKYKLTNLKDRMLNLGTKEGKMLNFSGKNSRTVSEEVYNLFDVEIERAVSGGFLRVDKVEEGSESSKKKEKKVNYDLDGDGDFDKDDKSLAGKVLQKKTSSKKSGKKKTSSSKTTTKK